MESLRRRRSLLRDRLYDIPTFKNALSGLKETRNSLAQSYAIFASRDALATIPRRSRMAHQTLKRIFVFSFLFFFSGTNEATAARLEGGMKLCLARRGRMNL